MDSWEEWKKKAGSWLGEAAQDTDRLARLGMRAYDRHGIERDLQRCWARLGRLVHPYLSGEHPLDGLLSDDRVRVEMGRIARLKDELEQTAREIESLRRRRREQERRAAAGTDQDASAADPAGGERASAEGMGAQEERAAHDPEAESPSADEGKGANPPGQSD